MNKRASAASIPLPRDWPEHATSAVVHAVGLARFVLTHLRAWCAESRVARVRLAAERDVALSEIAVLREEARILRSRVAAISARHRPRSPPPKRLAILALRAANGWTTAETARRFLVTVATIAFWMRRLDEGGEDALVAIPEPVNRYPDFVGELVRRMHTSFPALGKVRIADMLARASIHLAPATVARMLKKRPGGGKVERTVVAKSGRVVTATAVHELWHVDLTMLPTVIGWWTPWFPFALLQRWPWCFWLGAVLAHRFG